MSEQSQPVYVRVTLAGSTSFGATVVICKSNGDKGPVFTQAGGCMVPLACAMMCSFTAKETKLANRLNWFMQFQDVEDRSGLQGVLAANGGVAMT